MKLSTKLSALSSALTLTGLFVFGGVAQADTVTATFGASASPLAPVGASYSTNSGTNDTGTMAGLWTFTGATYYSPGVDLVGLAGAADDTFVGFCIDLRDGIGWGQKESWNLIDLWRAPNPSAGSMGPDKADDLSRMLATYLPDFSKASSTLSAAQAAGLQLAIWEIVWETNSAYSISGGTARFTSSADAQNWATSYLSGRWAPNGLTNLKAISLPTAGSETPKVQDFLVQVVPIPAAAWLFGSALLGTLALGRRKQKNDVEA